MIASQHFIHELSLLDLKTLALVTATEILEFLAGEPSPQEIMNYQVSRRAQERLHSLLYLNQEGLLNVDNQHELDELATIEHLTIMLKAEMAGKMIKEA